MTQIIKQYDDTKKAQAALAELKAAAFDNAEIVSNGKEGPLVAVDPPFGKGGQAETILNRHGPTRNGHANGYANGHGGASLLGSSTRLTGAPRITDSRTTLGAIFPELTGPNYFLSAMFGPLLSRSQKPFSSLASSQKPWSSLAASQKPWSSLASNQNGSAELINNPTPFSSMLGLPVLTGRRGG